MSWVLVCGNGGLKGPPVGSGGGSQQEKRRKLAEWNAAAYGQGCWKDRK
jgi:hypothetical protein